MNHPTYDRADEARRWDGPLADLWRTLSSEAYRLHIGDGDPAEERWAWRILPRGTVVAVRIRPDFRKELRIARAERPETDEARERWQRELADFLGAFEATGWQHVDEEAQGVAARFVQLYIGEYAVGVAMCVDCGEDVVGQPITREPRCDECKSRAFTAALAQRTAEANVRRTPPRRRRENLNLTSE